MENRMSEKHTYHLHAYCTDEEWKIISDAMEKAQKLPTGKIRQGDIVCTILIKWANSQNKTK